MYPATRANADSSATSGVRPWAAQTLQSLREPAAPSTPSNVHSLRRGYGAQDADGKGSYRLVAESRPLVALGGDFYEMSQVEGTALAVLGDVSGHGATASRLMLPMADKCHALALANPSPGEMVQALNDHCCSFFPDHMFATLVCVALDSARKTIRVANAGHVVPIIRRVSGETLLLGGPSGPPLGMIPGYVYSEQEFVLDDSDILLLLTDGVVDAIEHDLEGLSGVRSALEAASHGADAITSYLLQQTMSSLITTTDDLTIVTMERRKLEGSPSAPNAGRRRDQGTLHG